MLPLGQCQQRKMYGPPHSTLSCTALHQCSTTAHEQVPLSCAPVDSLLPELEPVLAPSFLPFQHHTQWTPPADQLPHTYTFLTWQVLYCSSSCCPPVPACASDSQPPLTQIRALSALTQRTFSSYSQPTQSRAYNLTAATAPVTVIITLRIPLSAHSLLHLCTTWPVGLCSEGGWRN